MSFPSHPPVQAPSHPSGPDKNPSNPGNGSSVDFSLMNVQLEEVKRERASAVQLSKTLRAELKEAKKEIENWQELNRRELRPSHNYTLSQFGLTEEELAKQFQDYRETFILNKTH